MIQRFSGKRAARGSEHHVGNRPCGEPAIAINNETNNAMQINSTSKSQHPTKFNPAPQTAPELKEVTLKTLVQLKSKLYANAARAMEQNPSKADLIQKAVDRDASRLAFTINMVQFKM
jgi:hypothetical protein